MLDRHEPVSGHQMSGLFSVCGFVFTSDPFSRGSPFHTANSKRSNKVTSHSLVDGGAEQQDGQVVAAGQHEQQVR